MPLANIPLLALSLFAAAPSDAPDEPPPVRIDVELEVTDAPQPPASVDPWTNAPEASAPEEPAGEGPPRADAPSIERRSDAPTSHERQEDPDPSDHGRGGVFAVSTGIASCAQPICTAARQGAIGRLAIGVRMGGSVEIGLDSSFARARAYRPSDYEADRGHIGLWDLVLGVRWNLLRRGRVIPHVGLGLGVSRITWRLAAPLLRWRQSVTRGLLRLSGGVDIRVSERVMIGPRIDQGLTFGGEACYHDSVDRGWCEKARKLFRGDGSFPNQTVRRATPRPWSVTISARFLF
ncbi:MAG: hypothetical protein KC420_09110 [Myxococcales bacterium]|nr:hypothetical protein [Myxococcales bacterium]